MKCQFCRKEIKGKPEILVDKETIQEINICKECKEENE